MVNFSKFVYFHTGNVAFLDEPYTAGCFNISDESILGTEVSAINTGGIHIIYVL